MHDWLERLEDLSTLPPKQAQGIEKARAALRNHHPFPPRADALPHHASMRTALSTGITASGMSSLACFAQSEPFVEAAAVCGTRPKQAEVPHMKLAAHVLAVMTVALSGCGGFKTIAPATDEIQWIRNGEQKLPVRDYSEASPYPIPIVSALPEILASPNTNAAPTDGVVEIADVQTLPYSAVAKLYFTVTPNSAYQCSASFIGAAKDVLLTAGHCVFETGQGTWNSAFDVRERYTAGSYLARHDWECVAIYSGWTQRQFPYDFAMIKLRTPASTSLGARIGLPTTRWESVGYPSNYYNGETLAKVTGTSGGVGAGVVRMASNPFGPGSSGGPWIDGGNAIGLNSFKYNADPNSMYGPLFDGKFTRLFEFVREGCSPDIHKTDHAQSLGESTEPAAADSSGELIAHARKPAPSPRGPTAAITLDVGLSATETRPQTPKESSLLNALSLRSPVHSCVASNISSNAYLMNYEHAGTSRRLLMYPGKSETLCNDASTSRMPKILSLRRVVLSEDGVGNPVATSVSPGFCRSHCPTSSNDGYCLKLGSSTIPVVKPLEGFLGDMVSSPEQNGLLQTKKQFIERLGGDPATVSDTCGRSDFYARDGAVVNDGLTCEVATPSTTKAAGDWGMSLLLSPHMEAARTPGTNAIAEFKARDNTGDVAFTGPDAQALTSNYGGRVVATEKVGDSTFITTENGCLFLTR